MTAAAEKQRGKVRSFSNRLQSLLTLQDEVRDVRTNQAPETLRQTKVRHVASGIKDLEWARFLLDYKGDVDEVLTSNITATEKEIGRLKGSAPPPCDPKDPYFPVDVDLSTLSLALLEAEMARLMKLIGTDKQVRSKYDAISKRLTSESANLKSLKEKLIDAQGAKERARHLSKERGEGYRRVFEAIIAEQSVLEELYKPLMKRLSKASGTLNKMAFSVTRVADVAQWARQAEETLLDRRKQGPFRGKGTLTECAEKVLKDAWENGTADEISKAMDEFRELYQEDLLAQSPVPKANQAEFRAWSKRFAHWLFSTSHIEINYGIQYDGVDIRKLSPGTRGIVLLLLYLALDDVDDRPLIIDQPEENLDPKSVYDELVDLFVSVKSTRQVIMVTHNANLVVNTDADQIIVADAGPHPPGDLPPITYKAGGLDNGEIRKIVCDILEGGEEAFKERARRLRVRIDR